MGRMKNTFVHSLDTARGIVLVTVLLLLSILSMSAYLAVERSQFSIRTNSNRLALLQAQYNAEESRRMALPILHDQLAEQQRHTKTVSGVQLHTNVTKLPMSANANRQEKASLVPLLRIQQSELQGAVYIMALPVSLNTQGVSLAQHRAYEGAGQGLGSEASFSKYFELRAKGIAQSRGKEVSYWNASDYRYVP